MDKYCQHSNEIKYSTKISSSTIGHGTKCYGMGELIQTSIWTWGPLTRAVLVTGTGIKSVWPSHKCNGSNVI